MGGGEDGNFLTCLASGERTFLWIYQPAYINPQSVVGYRVYTINFGCKEMVLNGRVTFFLSLILTPLNIGKGEKRSQLAPS